MSKADSIQTIRSYLGDGFIQIPAGAREDLVYNDITLDDFRHWVQIAFNSLDSINTAGKLSLIPEAILSNIVSHLNEVRRATSQLTAADQEAGNAFSNCINMLEQLIYQTTSYLILTDSSNYQNLLSNTDNTLSELTTYHENNIKETEAQKRKLANLNTKSANLLRKVSSGVLSKNFGEQSNSRWNIFLLVGSGILSILAFVLLLLKSEEATKYLIEGLEAGGLDYRVFFAKWSVMIPYLFLLSVALLELRSRIKLRDLYNFRQGVAGSLESYTESLLNKVDDMNEGNEKSEARRMVIEFMIDSMIELTRPPSIKSEKQSIGLKLRDVGEANITHS